MLTLLRKHPRFFGITMILVATLFIAVADALAKWLAGSYTTVQIAFMRSVTGFVYVSTFLLLWGRLRDLRTQYFGLHMLRSVLVTLILLGVFYALGQIPMVEVEAIGHAAPVFVALAAPWTLRERVTGHNWLAIGIGFFGVLIILRPDPGHFHIAHVVMLLSAAGYAVLIMLARKLSTRDPVLAITFYLYPLSVILTGLLVIGHWRTPTATHLAGFMLQGLAATVATLFYIAGLKHIEATLTATLDYVTLIWVASLGIVFWGEVPDSYTLAGIVLIVGSGIYIVRHSSRRIDESIVQTPEH